MGFSECSAVRVSKFSIKFEQRDLHFHFIVRPANYVVSPVPRRWEWSNKQYIPYIKNYILKELGQDSRVGRA